MNESRVRHFCRVDLTRINGFIYEILKRKINGQQIQLADDCTHSALITYMYPAEQIPLAIK